MNGTKHIAEAMSVKTVGERHLISDAHEQKSTEIPQVVASERGAACMI
jgi:hypothetical protein